MRIAREARLKLQPRRQVKVGIGIAASCCRHVNGGGVVDKKVEQRTDSLKVATLEGRVRFGLLRRP